MPRLSPSDTHDLLVVATLLLAGALLILVFDAPATDEDDYMPFALDDLLHGRNPYATEHTQDHIVGGPLGGHYYMWNTTYPYLPLLAVLQIPFVDYRWTALLAYAALLWAVRGSRLAFRAFANPLVLWLAAGGFNDFVVLALLAWSSRLGKGWPSWLASAAKQFALPLLALDAALRREWRSFLLAAGLAVLVTLPFVLWSPADFWRSAVAIHASRVPVVWAHVNYGLYVVYALVVTVPVARSARAAELARRGPASPSPMPPR